ncbi:MAG TPA: type II toxin-antitoxin system VapC family toxin [Gemmataceae bacterium]
MKQILDASVAFKWAIPEPESDIAIQLRDEYREGIHRWFAPDVFSIEIAHSLTRSERQGRIPVGEADRLWTDVMTTAPTLARSRLLLPRAIAISSHFRVGVYDCLYVALAERRKCVLVTADERLVVNLRRHFPFITSLASLPGA